VYGDTPKWTQKEKSEEGGKATKAKWDEALTLAKAGDLYDIDARIVIPHLRNLKIIAADHV